jgi:TPP-dependent pyruvate/acetoin dehydrogenase alpha subunit
MTYRAHAIELTPNKTYATRENAIKAVEKKFGTREFERNCWYFVAQHTDGRFFPVFVGERAIQAGIHFHFNVVA